MNIKNIFSYNSSKNYCNQIKKNKRQKKMLKYNMFLTLGLFNMNIYLLYYIFNRVFRSRTGRIYSDSSPSPNSKIFKPDSDRVLDFSSDSKAIVIPNNIINVRGSNGPKKSLRAKLDI